MKRDIQEIIKESAERYGLGYDVNQKVMAVEDEDGVIREITKEQFEELFECVVYREEKTHDK